MVKHIVMWKLKPENMEENAQAIKAALESIEEIVNLEGLDGIFIGPFDLSISMGIPGQWGSPAFKAALGRIHKACRKAGKLCLIYTNNAEEARLRLSEGYDAVANSIDSIEFTKAYRAIVGEIRK